MIKSKGNFHLQKSKGKIRFVERDIRITVLLLSDGLYGENSSPTVLKSRDVKDRPKNALGSPDYSER